METMELYQNPNFDKNEDLSKPGHTERCVCCNKPMKPEQVKYMVHMTTDWLMIDIDDVNLIDNSQGLFPVGSECKKHLPKEFVFKV
jgi:hypothetical protein